MNLDHFSIKVPASMMEEEKHFFCELLGLYESHRPDFPSKGYWLYSDDKPIANLSLGEQLVPGERQGYLDHVAFRSIELRDLQQRLETAGIEYSTNHVPSSV